jgi:phage terminase small subunit
MQSKLSDKQKAFVEAYLTCWNGYKAAITAGYSEASARHQASRLLSYDNIHEAIQARLAELKMSADEVLTRLSEHARGSIADFVTVSEPSTDLEDATDAQDAKAIAGGWRLDLLRAQQAGKLHLIKKLKSGQWGPEIELHDPQAALALLGKHHKLFVEKIEHTGADGGPLFKVYEKTDAFDPDDA